MCLAFLASSNVIADDSVSFITSSPVLEVLAFGAAAGKAGAEAARQPRDFLFARSGVGTLPKPVTRLTGPVTATHDDSWQTVLQRLQIPAHTWVDILLSGDRSDWPRRPLVASKIWIEWSEQLTPLAMYYSPFSRQMRKVTFVSGKLALEQGSYQSTVAKLPAGTANTPLYAAVGSVGLPDAIADQLGTIFAGVLDFHRDLQGGYQGIVLFEMLKQPDQSVRPGRVMAAHLGTASGSFSAYLFDENNGNAPIYVAADGTPLRRRLLQSPLVFSRVTSGYAIQRFHPILLQWQAHSGIDFAAPLGTPVRTTAAGVVAFAGVRGGYGNCVIVSHPDGLTSWYAHLSQIDTRVAPGTALGQGEVIGLVGMSGLATGPHLHYEIRREGVPIDPVVVSEEDKLPAYDQQQKLRLDYLLSWYDAQIAALQSHTKQR